jgi:hypothetical protein
MGTASLVGPSFPTEPAFLGGFFFLRTNPVAPCLILRSLSLLCLSIAT